MEPHSPVLFLLGASHQTASLAFRQVPVPEPGSLPLLGFGMTVLASMRRRARES